MKYLNSTPVMIINALAKYQSEKNYMPNYTISIQVLYICFHTGLWLDYIETELLYPGGDPGRVGDLHWRAVKELQPELTAEFISKYSLLHIQ